MMNLKMTCLTFALAATALPALAHDGETHELPPNTAPGIHYGDSLSIGNGRYRTYIKNNFNGKPLAVGVEFSQSTLENLPMHPVTDGKTCFDTNGDNALDLHDECVGGHSRTLYFEGNVTQFKSITINWEPHGHVPADVYDRPHFDFHFYTVSDIDRNMIFPGTCAGGVNCAQSAKAINPIPAKYVHPDMFNTNLVYAHMGNHYADSASPEFHGQTFTHTFILGAFDTKITFYEPMVSLEYLQTKPNQCTPIKQPAAYETSGWYATEYCIRYEGKRKFYNVSLEGFKYRIAS
ncbi:MAG: hypothetical protein WKG03_19085 [Telluria sp.]